MDASSPPSPVAVFLDLSHLEYWQRREWENLLSQASPADIRFTASAQGADCELTTGGRYALNGTGPRAPFPPPPQPGEIPRFAWDFHDFPSGFDPGLYCSLPRYLYDRARHRTFCYPLTYNEEIAAFDLADADLLFGFCGGISSGLRARMIESIMRSSRPEERRIVVQSGPWNAMYDRSGLPVKKEYAQTMRRSRFSLCPRGNGVASIRLFETMKAARVPVIISDEYVLPDGIDWPACSIVIKEKDLAALPAILRAKESEWPQMAANARTAWENNFAENRLFGPLARHLRELSQSAAPIGPIGKARIRSYPAARKVLVAVTHIRQRLNWGWRTLTPRQA